MGFLPKDMPPLREGRAWLAYVASHDAHPFIQFVKYGLAGVCALATDVLFFALADFFVFPIGEGLAGSPTLPDSLAGIGQWLSDMREDPRVLNYIRCSVIGFLFSNVVAYYTNLKWVFRGGRHKRHVEMALFFTVSLVAFVIGVALGSFLVGSFHLNAYVAKAGNVVAAILINYLCRKFLVFKG